MKTLYPIALLILIVTSCSTLDPEEIKSIDKNELELTIASDYDLFNLRFDIENDDYTTYDDEEITTTGLPYHELGFDLGNGLFFDLNNNLSFRLDKLLNISEGDHFEIERNKTPNSSTKTQYKYQLSTFSKKSTLSFNYHEKFKIQYLNDSIAVTEKHKLKYSIIKKDSTIIKRNKHKIKDALYHHDISYWTTNTNREKGAFFYLENDYINLNEYFIIELSKNKKQMKIFTVGASQDYLIYTIERNDNLIYIYNEDYRGYKIERSPDEVKIYHNDKLTEVVSLIR